MNEPNPEVLGIVVAEFNRDITGAMLAAAQDEAAKLNVKVFCVVRVPGTYEVPLIADELLGNSKITALVVLGYIEKGETLHGEVMGHTVHQCLLNSSLAMRKPVGLGIIGPGALWPRRR